MTDIDPTQIRRNAYTDNLGEDLIAVDALGNVLARAGDRASVEKAAPDHAGVFGAADLEPKAKKPAPKPKDEPAPVVEEAPAPIAAADEQPENPLDHDGDGESGGSKAGEESTAAVGAARKRKPAKDTE